MNRKGDIKLNDALLNIEVNPKAFVPQPIRQNNL